MSVRKHTPIETQMYRLLLRFTRLSEHFPKRFRTSSGDRTINFILDMIDCAVSAYDSKEERDINLKKIRTLLTKIEYSIRVAHDCHMLNRNNKKDNEKKYLELCAIVTEIAQQLSRWSRSITTKCEFARSANPYEVVPLSAV